jgi:lipopolysaccharide transport system ATP-binding protein
MCASRAVIEVEGLGKRYTLGEDNVRTRLAALIGDFLRDDKLGHWALSDVSFRIEAGEAIGIIGRNGAGKSTLLKILSRITLPTTGRARVEGRVGTLLEVGTGFHPDLTGRDNIYLSGTILGMTHREVASHFDEIVEFSGIEKFINTPVKRYSSGMYVRLAFAVASFLEPDILIVDEVLAVGDASFQRKSLARLNEATGKEGRTVLFVSHNLQSIRTFCERVLVLERGKLVYDGPTDEGISRYLETLPKWVDVRETGLKDRLNRTTGAVRFTTVTPRSARHGTAWKAVSGEAFELRFEYEVIEPVRDLAFLIQLRSALNGQVITVIRDVVRQGPCRPGERGAFDLVLPDLPLRQGEISLYACLSSVDDTAYYDVVDANVDLPFLMVSADAGDTYQRKGVVNLKYELRRDVVPLKVTEP